MSEVERIVATIAGIADLKAKVAALEQERVRLLAGMEFVDEKNARLKERIVALEQERNEARSEAEFYLGACIHPDGRTDLIGQARQYAKVVTELARLRGLVCLSYCSCGRDEENTDPEAHAEYCGYRRALTEGENDG